MSLTGRKTLGVISTGVAMTLASGAWGPLAMSSSAAGASPTATSSTASTQRAQLSSLVSTSGFNTVLGKPHPAKGSPVVFGMINIETAPGGDFPEARQGTQAAIAYVNEYRGGLGGHPMKLINCVTDGTATTSQNCANTLVADHPVAVFGATDLASAATLPILAKAGLDEFGGIDLTPPMVTAPNSLVFNDVALGGNAAESAFIAQQLHAKKVGVIAIGDAEGQSQANNFIIPVLATLGVKTTENLVPPSVADATSAVASAVSGSPDAYFVESPSQCVSILTALKNLGNTKPVVTIDPCSSPGVVKAANGATASAYFSSPYLPPSSRSADSVLYNTILNKLGPPKMARDSTSQEGVQEVINIWNTFHSTPVSKLTSAYMMATLKSGSNHPNFLSSPYSCNSKAAPMFPDLCDAVQYIHQITASGNVVQPSMKAWYGLPYLGKKP